MASSRGQHSRTMAAILHADVAGSTELVQRDESLAHERINDAFGRLASSIKRYGGTVHEIRGDALVAEFSRASDSVCAALEFQQAHGRYNSALGDDIAPVVRVGISLGEVVFADGVVTGAGVVLAQRVEQLAKPGGVCITGAIHEALPKHMPFNKDNLGERSVKGFEEPVRVYAIGLQEGAEPPAPESLHQPRNLWRTIVVTLAALAALAALGVAMWRPWQPDTETAPVGQTENAQPDKPSIVVLPFDNMSSDPEQAYFADGITEDITTHLSKIGELFVISRNSAFSYKGKSIRARQIADELGVRYLLEGSVRRSANQVRINAQLIDGTTGNHLWAELYDGTLENIFAVQDKVTAQIVEALKVRLTNTEQKRVYETETESPDAYDAYLKGWRYYLSNSSEELPLARDYFEQALTLDSNYTRAYAALAAVYYKALTEQWYTLRIDDWAMQRRLNENLERAMRDPNSLALTVAARIEIRKGQHANAIKHARSAIELEPNSAIAHTVLGKAMLFEGRQGEALKNLEIAIQLDPLNTSEPLGLSGLSRFLLGETDVAVSLLEKSLGHHPERSAAGAGVTLTAAYAQLERKDDARNQAETMRQLWKDYFWAEPDIVDIMTHFPFSRAADARQLAENLLLAGVCCEQDVENVLRSKKK